MIEEAVSYGDLIATYIHGVVLLSESNPKGIGKLLEVLNDEHRKHIFLKCQTTLQLLATRISMYQSPNFQICQKNWNGTFELWWTLNLMVMKNLWFHARNAPSTLKCLSWWIGFFKFVKQNI